MQKDNMLVSVIVPVFNQEACLNQCIDSILIQSYKFLEIILIDDGSTDRSGVICDEYKKLDNRIIVIHNKNSGVGHARNCGINASKGKFIVFIDSDDYVERNYISALMEPLIKDDYDMVVCGYLDLDVRTSQKKYHLLKEKELNELSGLFYKDYHFFKQIYWFPVVKVYKADIIKNKNIKFPENITDCEDAFFNFLYYVNVNKYFYINQALYTYCHRSGVSVSRQITLQSYKTNVKKLQVEKVFLKAYHVSQYEKVLVNSAFVILRKYSHIKNSDYNEFKLRIIEVFQIIREELDAADDLTLKKRIAINCLKRNFFLPVYVYWGVMHWIND